MGTRRIKIYRDILLTLIFLSLLAAFIQGGPFAPVLSRNLIITGCILPIVLIFVLLLLTYIFRKERLTEEKVVFAIIFSGMLLHCCYILLSGLYERQHDEGVYTGIATSQINPGHIGYIEYIYKFHKLPDMNPYQLFSYYHPPLHYILSAGWLILLTSLGMPENLAFENLQILPLFYSGLLMLLTYAILRKTGAAGRALYAGVFLTAMHPALTIMSGSVNNDMLSTLLLSCCIYTTLCFIQDRSLKNLILIALSIGFGMLCKINIAIMALPIGLVFLLHFISVVREGDRTSIFACAKNYLIFGAISAITGLSWITRNLLRFHVKPGISSATEASVMYTGDYGLWERIGIPAVADWHFDFPFHPLSGDVIHNIWVIMFQTSLFAEEYPYEIMGVPLALCRLAYLIAIILAVGSAVIFTAAQFAKFKNGVWEKRIEAVFLFAGYITFLLSFVVFSLKYPYTCSSDFRYIVICLVFIAAGLADSVDIFAKNKCCAALCRITRLGMCAELLLTTIIYITWKQW